MRRIFKLIASIALLISTKSNAQTFTLKERGTFLPQHKTVIRVQDSANHSLILFRTKLQVNTDGTPISYHPQDLYGQTKAINTIGNAIAVRKTGQLKNLCLDKTTYNKAIGVFRKFINSGYETVPEGYQIVWENVLISKTVNGTKKPCVIQNGEYAGYFASATSLKNGLTENKGECSCNDQVNPLRVPSLVLVGGNDNVVARYGAKLGDLLVAYNPANHQVVYAIINDKGPKHNLGEGSVLLNMLLLNKKAFPKSRKDTYGLITPDNILIAVIPNSRNYKKETPYTQDNVASRVGDWMKEIGLNTQEEVRVFLDKQALLLQ